MIATFTDIHIVVTEEIQKILPLIQHLYSYIKSNFHKTAESYQSLKINIPADCTHRPILDSETSTTCCLAATKSLPAHRH